MKRAHSLRVRPLDYLGHPFYQLLDMELCDPNTLGNSDPKALPPAPLLAYSEYLKFIIMLVTTLQFKLERNHFLNNNKGPYLFISKQK